MTGFNAVQLALAAAAGALAASRLWLLWRQAPLDVDAFVDALDAALSAGEWQLARRMATACEPAWPAWLAAHALGPHPDARAELEQTLSDLVTAAWRGKAALSTFARIAGPLALIGVIFELGAAAHETGLQALQRGLPLQLGAERSLLTFAIGIATTFACIASTRSLSRGARALERALKRVAGTLDRHLAARGRDM